MPQATPTKINLPCGDRGFLGSSWHEASSQSGLLVITSCEEEKRLGEAAQCPMQISSLPDERIIAFPSPTNPPIHRELSYAV
jgi:hypothetical protein